MVEEADEADEVDKVDKAPPFVAGSPVVEVYVEASASKRRLRREMASRRGGKASLTSTSSHAACSVIIVSTSCSTIEGRMDRIDLTTVRVVKFIRPAAGVFFGVVCAFSPFSPFSIFSQVSPAGVAFFLGVVLIGVVLWVALLRRV